jgi:hypothetical protein
MRKIALLAIPLAAFYLIQSARTPTTPETVGYSDPPSAKAPTPPETVAYPGPPSAQASPTPGAVIYVGIPSARMNRYAAAQRASQWCWAASIQMVLNFYGVHITQPQIVARTYGMDPDGPLPDWGGNLPGITANLNNWSIDNLGRRYTVRAEFRWGPPPPSDLYRELQQGRPVLVAYRSGPVSGHAVVITAAGFSSSPSGLIPRSIVVRDPWPSEENRARLGRVEYSFDEFAQLIDAYWYIRVQ